MWLRLIAILSQLRMEFGMSSVKEMMTEVIRSQPEDASYEEIMRELAFERMVELGLDDSRRGRVISNEDMEHRIRSWQK
jgi:predicted transcriptional regulator